MDFKPPPSLLLIGLKNVARGKSWQNPRDELQNITNVKISFFVDTLINSIIYIMDMTEPITIKCIRYYIYKPYINFVKDGLLKKLLKLYRLY